MKNQFGFKIPACVVAFAIATTGTQVIAQEGSRSILEEIVVTARKRSESILEIPIAITAFSSQDIEAYGLESIEDVHLYTPGFTYEKWATVAGRNDQSPRFRGIGVETTGPLRQTASVFVDGVFVVNAASGISLSDVERVEVIKGPQSAHFGRNTFGGAVNYITKTPGDEFSAHVDMSLADRDDYEITASIDGPISDVVSGRLSASWHDDGGHYDNLGGAPGEMLGDEETTSITGSLFFNFSERLSAKLRVGLIENEDGAPAAAIVDSENHNCGPFNVTGDSTGGIDSTICGDVPVLNNGASTTVLGSSFGQTIIDNIEPVSAVGTPRSSFGFDRSTLMVSGQVAFDITENLTLTALTGYADDEANLLNDSDSDGRYESFIAVNARAFEMFSQEFRLSGTSDRFDWSIGFNYFDQEFKNAGQFVNPSTRTIFGRTPGALYGDLNPNLESVETLGVFGSLTYRVTDQFQVSVEGRRQTDEITNDDDITNSVGSSAPLNAEFKNFLPRVIFDYAVSDDTLLYASYSEGNLPGGFNVNVIDLTDAQLAELRTFEPNVRENIEEEELEQIEFGVKHAFGNGKGSISAALYFIDRINQGFIRNVVLASDGGRTTGYTINAGGSESNGLEIEGRYQFNDMFGIQGGIGYSDATFTEFVSGRHNDVFGDADENAAGKSTARFPDVSGSISLTFDGNVSSDMSWFGRIDTSYMGERYFDETNLPTAEAGVLMNLRAGIRTDSYSIELFVKNATDSDLLTAAQASADLALGFRPPADANPFGGFSGFGVQSQKIGLRDRRQFGLRAGYNF